MHTRSREFKVLKTEEFDAWLAGLHSVQRTRVSARLDLLSIGHFGDHKRFDGILEFRWKNGTRLYAMLWESAVIVALYGGDKNGQSRGIKKAKKIQREVLEGARPFHIP